MDARPQTLRFVHFSMTAFMSLMGAHTLDNHICERYNSWEALYEAEAK